MSDEARSEFELLEFIGRELLKANEEREAAKARAKSLLVELLDILISCKLRGVMPPFGLIEMARKNS